MTPENFLTANLKGNHESENRATQKQSSKCVDPFDALDCRALGLSRRGEEDGGDDHGYSEYWRLSEE
jgi:hypothetical protein